MSIVPIVFLGTPEFARHHLAALIEDVHYQVVGVITQPDRPAGRSLKLSPSPVKELAVQKGLPVWSPEKINEPEVLKAIQDLHAEAAVVVAYGQILPQRFLDIFPKRVVNIHGSLLPRWRGAAPIQRSLMNGDQETGVSLQVMVRKMDAGDVLGVRRIKISEDMDAQKLHDRMKELGVELLHVEFMDYLRGNLAPQPQDETQVTFAPKIDKSEGQILWTKSATEISNQIRALSMGPGCFFRRGNETVKVHRAQRLTEQGNPGQVLAVNADAFTVACGQGAIKISEVQPQSRARMKVSDYLRGYPLKAGEMFS